MSRRNALHTSVVALAIAGLGAFSALALAAGSSSTNPSVYYSVLRKAAKPSDGLSADARQLARGLPSRLKLHPNDARATRLKPGKRAWLVPGKSSICLFTERSGAVRASCNGLTAARTGALYLTDYRKSDKSLRKIIGALPDDASGAQLVGRGGRARDLELRRNTYSVHLSKRGAGKFKPKSVSFLAGGKPYSIPL